MKANILWAACLLLAACNTPQGDTAYFAGDPAVDLSQLIAQYEKAMHMSEDNENYSIELRNKAEMQAEDDCYIFADSSFVLHVPQYNNSQHPFLKVAEDFYNCSALTWGIWSNVEISYTSETNDNRAIVESIKSIPTAYVKDSLLQTAADAYKDGICHLLTINSEKWGKDTPGGLLGTFIETIEGKLPHLYTNEDAFMDSLRIIVEMSEKLSDKKFAEYEEADENSGTYKALTLLNDCSNFDEQCSLLLRWADTKQSKGDDPWVIAVASQLLRSGHYNPMLFQIWLMWRSLFQLEYCGASRYSAIPHDLFNDMRRSCYTTCLRRIQQYPDDIFAINCAHLLAGHCNISRTGEYMFGNEAAVEVASILPGRYHFLNDDEEEEDSVETTEEDGVEE